MLQFEWKQASLVFAEICEVERQMKKLRLISAFPILTKTEEWIVRVDRAHDCYGAFESVIEGRTASGHSLQWFAPQFGFEGKVWHPGGLVRVAFAALALKLEPYDAKPIVIDRGPLVDEERKRLRAEGKIDEARRKGITVEVITSELRTFYSQVHDHHEFVGRIERVRPIRPRPEFRGWLLDVEVLPDRPATGSRMPLYVFPAALGDYRPRRGDLVHGTAWLQGRWVRRADKADRAAWRACGGKGQGVPSSG